MANPHVLERLAALPVNAEIANREQGDPPGRLGRALVVSDHVKELLKSAMPN